MFYTPSLIFLVIDYYKSQESYNISYLTDTINSQTSGNKSPSSGLKYFASISDEAKCVCLKVSLFVVEDNKRYYHLLSSVVLVALMTSDSSTILTNFRYY